MQEQLDSDRDNDRRLREQIDPLVGELSPLGKFELATRLIGESMVDSVRRRRTIDVQPAIPIRVVRVIEPASSPSTVVQLDAGLVADDELATTAEKEEGEREEAPKSGSPDAHDDDAFRRHDKEGGSE